MPEYARVCQSMPEYARVLPEYARVCQSMPEYARVGKGMQEYARVCQSMPEYSRVCQSMPEYARVCQRMPEYARVCHSVPGARGILNCQREKCFVCNSGGKEGICRKTGVGYRITCNECEDEVAKYEGETGRNMFIRGCEHAQDVAKKAVDKPLWKHIVDKHEGVMARPIFSQFKMDATNFFRSAQRRKANEG